MHSGSVPKQEVICAILNKNRNKKDIKILACKIR